MKISIKETDVNSGVYSRLIRIMLDNGSVFQPGNNGNPERVTIAIFGDSSEPKVVEVLQGKKPIVERVVPLSDLILPEEIRSEIFATQVA